MGSSHRRRRERRFRRYLSRGRLSKAQSLFLRHPRLDIDAGEPPPLHRSCARHDAPALRLLLCLGADPTHQDRHGNTALHAAAQQGPSAYKDFFLPLMTQCPTAMKMKNKQGETPGELLGWESPPEPSVESEEEEEEAYREREWRQKLQEELEDEWQEMLGRFEGDEDATLDTPEPESFSAWTERLAREHAQKRRQQQATKRARHPKCPSASCRSWQQQEKECRLFQERAQAKEEELRESRARRTQEDRGHCGGDCNRTKPMGDLRKGGHTLWCFKDIPWPCLGGRDPEAMAAALVARGPPPTDRGALRKYLRAQQVQWHPDRFLQRFGCQIEAREREKVMEIVTALSQALNRHAEDLK
ncbi:NF-kappa-B inhibitor-like protein 1 isoform X2 [Phascolarctos cinereus]|nr:NF-kappa-B inhibitor-like protein 1 isoform X3 [Phascolarctos cinereus]XP_020829720.1 NF-kappa-B inhibitor-like protein 1 isoform X3 [Phascolarctos cinereus]XP_020829721.1 NF-kappa-B inhibitor-like protein 1 isoform X3 [Phascolarctos cinereus]XP_020829722.1 NF-kappa-B inhibitor-like protein 1 isoform X3 [Phascolarctos cinereus]